MERGPAARWNIQGGGPCLNKKRASMGSSFITNKTLHILMGSCSAFTAASAAWKPIFEWVPSQNGLLTDAPQRHRETLGLPVRSYRLPSASVSSSSLRSPVTE